MAAAKKILVIVESPSKAKTIGKFLGSRYKVIASVGHVRDLPKSKLGIDIDNDFEPRYISIRGKGDIIKELKKEAKNASNKKLCDIPSERKTPEKGGCRVSEDTRHIMKKLLYEVSILLISTLFIVSSIHGQSLTRF